MNTTITIELPEALAARLARLPPEDVNAFTVAALTVVADDLEGADADTEPDEELIAALKAGIAEAEAGKLLTAEEVDAHMEAAFAARRKEREAAVRGR